MSIYRAFPFGVRSPMLHQALMRDLDQRFPRKPHKFQRLTTSDQKVAWGTYGWHLYGPCNAPWNGQAHLTAFSFESLTLS